MLNPPRRPRGLDAARQALGEAELALDLRQHQNPAVRGQPTGINLNRLTGDG
jgi:hypothetical protein